MRKNIFKFKSFFKMVFFSNFKLLINRINIFIVFGILYINRNK